MQSLRLLFLFVVLGTVLVSASPFNAVAKDDSDSSGGSSDNGGGSNSGSNDNSNGGSDSNNGNDNSGDNSNNGNDKKGSEDKTPEPINDPLHPGKDDTKDISDIPGENCNDKGQCATGIDKPKPIPPCRFDCPRPPPPPPKPGCDSIICITIVKIIHGGSGSHHSSNSGSMSQLCYSVMHMVWNSHMQKGQNNEIDNYVNNCLGAK